jgi:uncharacterized protein (TIGR00375 family)
MRVIADLHIHSRFSRATSKRLGPALLDRWGRIKGLDLLGTGDCTHPGWLKELREQLDDAEEGLYTLKDDLRAAFNAGPALAGGIPEVEKADRGGPVRFVLSGELSTLYRQGDRTRKVHHLVLLPDFKAAAAFQTRLERVGNINSDGRPILGINSRDLMSLLLESDERSILIPAHIWTPWFSVLGAKSGFDSIEECYGDLSSHIPAVETGLSSNPPMNWALSSLDHYGIISNSDAHSPDKLGREATVFEMERSYPSLREALFSRSCAPGIVETIEFFPQEGKYHYDGHRSCGVCLSPKQALATGGLCPVCGKPLTRGVMGRVLELANRPVDEAAPCPAEDADGSTGSNRRPYRSLIPLKEILGELLETGPSSKKVDVLYGALIEKAGPEFSILLDMEARELERFRLPGCSGELLARALERMRAGEVSVNPGYDGEYGHIRAFPPGALPSSREGAGLFGDTAPAGGEGGPPADRAGKKAVPAHHEKGRKRSPPAPDLAPPGAARGEPGKKSLSPEQDAAVLSQEKFALIIAGPGSGKTATLTARIVRLLEEGVEPASILALSFTVKAAAELQDRICRAAPGGKGVVAATFHSFCASFLREKADRIGMPDNFGVLGEKDRELIFRKFIGTEAAGNRQVRWLGKYIESRKQFLLLPKEKRPPFGGDMADLIPLAEAMNIPKPDGRGEWFYRLYREELFSRSMLDFDDLVMSAARLLILDRDVLSSLRKRFRHILVDEYQDLNFAQYVLIRLLAPNNAEAQAAAVEGASLWVIGDPNQAIYGFRGSDSRFIGRFAQDYAGAARFRLSRSFRCAEALTGAASRLTGETLEGNNAPVTLGRSACPSDNAEAEGIARRISGLIGGSSFFAIDSGAAAPRQGQGEAEPCAPADCAILLRTTILAPPIIKALKNHGIPYELTGEQPWWEEEPALSLLVHLRENPYPPELSPVEAVKAAWEHNQSQTPPKKQRGNPPEPVLPEPVARLISLAGFFDTVPALLDTLSTSGPEGVPEIKGEGVKIMSIHASKGLEFSHVFVAALEDGLLPFILYYDTEADTALGGGPEERLQARIDEERRLLYVAMTRARKGLYLSWARSRNFRGRILKSEPSRFLAGLESLIPLVNERPPPARDSQLKLF